jgi:hypothetical protein
MTFYNLYRLTIPALKIAFVSAMLSVGIPIPVSAADQFEAAQVEIEVRNVEENRLQEQSKAYDKQASTLADRYAMMAKLVAKQGGDPKPLLDAASYFTNQSK